MTCRAAIATACTGTATTAVRLAGNEPVAACAPCVAFAEAVGLVRAALSGKRR